MTHPLVVAITGASGAVYAKRLLEVLATGGHEVHLLISPAAQSVFRQELNVELNLKQFNLSQMGLEVPQDNVHFYPHHDYFSPVASGSFLTQGMVICPCSGGTLSGVVHGSSANLIHRAADVHLKERRKLILVPRETPLSLIHLENMTKATQAGAVILPAAPGWYHGVRGLDDLVDFIVARILDQLQVPHQLMNRWGDD